MNKKKVDVENGLCKIIREILHIHKPAAIESSVILPKRTTMEIFPYELRVPYKQIKQAD